MIGFSPTEDQKMMVDSVGQFAKTLRPRVREIEKARAVPEDLRKTAHELGLGLVALPESIGGAGLGMTTAVLLEEEVAWGDSAAAFGFGGPGAFGLAVAELASAEQAKAILAPFAAEDGYKRFGAVAWGERKPVADREGFATKATRTGDGWTITGDKTYVTSFDRADAFVVFAQVDESKGWDGLGAFLVRKGTPGLSTKSRHQTLGLDVASFGDVRFENVKVSESDRLAGGTDFNAAVLRFFVKHALHVAAREVGLSRAAFETTREYCDTRKAFGKPIGHFQAVAFTLADRAMDVEASRTMVQRAAWCWDALAAGNPTVTESDALLKSAYAISYAHEAAMRCGDDGVQLHGGSGFMRDYPVEKFMRDAKQLGVCGMTAEQADQLAALVELGAPVRLGAVLPTPETQATFV